jgi:hypothetical protein
MRRKPKILANGSNNDIFKNHGISAETGPSSGRTEEFVIRMN